MLPSLFLSFSNTYKGILSNSIWIRYYWKWPTTCTLLCHQLYCHEREGSMTFKHLGFRTGHWMDLLCTYSLQNLCLKFHSGANANPRLKSTSAIAITCSPQFNGHWNVVFLVFRIPGDAQSPEAQQFSVLHTIVAKLYILLISKVIARREYRNNIIQNLFTGVEYQNQLPYKSLPEGHIVSLDAIQHMQSIRHY